MSEYKYIGFRVKQREDAASPVFFTFYATPKEIVKWATVKEVEKTPEGTQRMIRNPRRKAIRRFLESSSINTIPNSVLIAVEAGKATISEVDTNQFEDSGNKDISILATMNISMTDEDAKPAMIVDGQHRIYGMSDFADENIPILVVALIDADVNEQAFQFIVINNKSVKVPTDNVKAIIANFDEALLKQRLLDAGVRYGKNSPMLTEINTLEVSPFKNLLSWPNTRGDGEKLVPITAIEHCMKVLTKEFSNLEDDEDSCLGVFFTIWTAVKETYPALWGKENKFMKKVNIIALHEFLTSRIKAGTQMGFFDILEVKAIDRILRDMLKKIPNDFWDSAWTVRIQDNSNVRDSIKRDIEVILQNSGSDEVEWSEGLRLVKGR